MHRGTAAFELVTHLPVIDADAGDSLDDLVVNHVLTESGAAVDDIAPTAMAEFRAACLAAKERLTVAPEVRLPLPHKPGDLVITRARFDELVRPVAGAMVERVRRLVAAVPDDQLAGASLAGGTARVPVFAALTEAALDCPVAVEPDPATAVARGAALAARPRLAGGPPTGIGPVSTDKPPVDGTPRHAARQDDLEQHALVRGGGGVAERSVPGLLAVDPGRAPVADPPPRPPVDIAPLTPPPRRFTLSRRSRRDADSDEDSR